MEDIIAPGFGQRFKSLFEGLTYEEIGGLIGVGKSAVSNYVDDRVPKIKILFKICGLRPVSIHWLLTGEGPQKREELLSFKPGTRSEPIPFQTQAESHRIKRFTESLPKEDWSELVRSSEDEDQWFKAKLWFTNWARSNFGFAENEWAAIEEIADAGGITAEDTIAHLVRESLAAKGFGEMPEVMPVMTFQTIDDEVFKLIDQLPEEKKDDEVHRLIGKLVARAAGR